MCRVARVPQRSSRCVGPTVRDTNTATLGNSNRAQSLLQASGVRKPLLPRAETLWDWT